MIHLLTECVKENIINKGGHICLKLCSLTFLIISITINSRVLSLAKNKSLNLKKV